MSMLMLFVDSTLRQTLEVVTVEGAEQSHTDSSTSCHRTNQSRASVNRLSDRSKGSSIQSSFNDLVPSSSGNEWHVQGIQSM